MNRIVLTHHFFFLSFFLVSGLCSFTINASEQKKQYRRRILEKARSNQEKKEERRAKQKKLLDSFYDEGFDYSRFQGRVTDRDKTNHVLKVSSENQNTRFFRSGDLVRFRISARKTELCEGYVRSVEKSYFVIYVKDMAECWAHGDYFRRGALLSFQSVGLAERVRDAAVYRLVLMKRRGDFLKQLNGVNHFVWSFEQERVKIAANYDQQIANIEKAKQKALENILIKKKDSIVLQQELSYRLDLLDKDLEHYRVEKDEPLIDRWNLDHDLGLPVAKRPSQLKFRD